jgi:hypothetical protein
MPPPQGNLPSVFRAAFLLWGREMNTRLEFSAKNGVRNHDNDNNKLGTVRPLEPSDERSIDHPCHKKHWLEFAAVLGRLEAREEFAMIRDNDER